MSAMTISSTWKSPLKSLYQKSTTINKCLRIIEKCFKFNINQKGRRTNSENMNWEQSCRIRLCKIEVIRLQNKISTKTEATSRAPITSTILSRILLTINSTWIINTSSKRLSKSRTKPKTKFSSDFAYVFS